MTRHSVWRIVAALFAVLTLASGCELFEAPPPVASSQENVGVDPTGETIDTSTAPPESPGEEPLTRSPSTAQVPRTAAPPADAASPPSATRLPGTAPSDGRVAAGGSVRRHHHLRSSRHGSGDTGANGSSAAGGE